MIRCSGNGDAETSEARVAKEAHITVGSRRTRVKSTRSHPSGSGTVGRRRNEPFDPSGKTDAACTESDMAPPRETTNISRPESKPMHLAHPKPKICLDQQSPTIRQGHFTGPIAANGSARPLRTVREGGIGNPSSFQQPEMDEGGSQSFVFGTPGQAPGHLTSTTPRPPIAAPAGHLADEGSGEYVGGSDGNPYALDY